MSLSPIERDRLIFEELESVRKKIAAYNDASFPPDVRALLCCLRKHLYEETCNVNAILACSGVTSPSLHARFKYHVGTTIRRYLEQHRLKAARRLLQHDGLEIHVIAFSVGYTSYRTFGRAFRRYFGCTPTDCREKMSRENV